MEKRATLRSWVVICNKVKNEHQQQQQQEPKRRRRRREGHFEAMKGVKFERVKRTTKLSVLILSSLIFIKVILDSELVGSFTLSPPLESVWSDEKEETAGVISSLKELEPAEQVRIHQQQQQQEQTTRTKRRSERKPILNEFSFPANLVQGMKYVILCQVLTGDTPIQIRWLKDNKEILPIGPIQSDGSQQVLIGNQEDQVAGNGNSQLGDSNGIEFLASEEIGASLIFRPVQAKQAGNYTCLASNKFGSSSYSSQMSVKVPPKWKIEPQDRESIMGEQIIIDCQAIGNPNPFIRWKFATLIKFHSLQQLKLQQQNQNIDSDSANQNLIVTDQNIGESQSQLLQHQQQQQQFKLINSNHHVQTLENGSLAIRQTNKEHEGIYMCEADNGVEPNLVKSLRLLVHLQAQFVDEIQHLDPSTVIQQQQSSISSSSVSNSVLLAGASLPMSQGTLVKVARVVQNTNQTRLLCQPFGDLPLTVDWFKDGQLVYSHTWTHQTAIGTNHQVDVYPRCSVETRERRANLGSTSQQHHQSTIGQSHQMATSKVSTTSHPLNAVFLESQLSIVALRRSDGGIYSCIARNAFGQAERKLRLLVQEPPEAPEVVDIAYISSRYISLRWLAPPDGNSPIVKYIVEYRRQLDHRDQTGPSETGDGNGNSIQYPYHSDKLMPLKGTQNDQTELVQSQAQIQSQSQQAQQIQHTIHELEPMTRYSMRIVAVNSIGRSRPSVALNLRTDEEVPSVVPTSLEHRVLSSRSVRLHWTITYSSEHELIDGFFVGYRSFEPASTASSGATSNSNRQSGQTGSDSVNDQLDLVSKSKTSQSSGQEVTQSTFTYKTILLIDPKRDQISSDDKQQQQQQSVSPTVSLAPLTTTTKTIPPTNQGFTHLNNNPSHQQQSGLVNHHEGQTLLVQTFEYVIGSLQRDTEYAVLLQCFNKKGAGPPSDQIVFKTFANDPPEKFYLSVEASTESSIRLNWRPTNSFSTDSRHLVKDITNSLANKQTDPIDGFVLEYARIVVPHNRANPQPQSIPLINLRHSNHHYYSNSSVLVPKASGYIRGQSTNSIVQTSGLIDFNYSQLDHWQAIQLQAHEKMYDIKNLECGASYAFKIWAFNKVGRGEPSDIVATSTKGQAPIAPDRHKFLTVNSTQVRIHLGAWSDGGCDIDKFTIQYRVLGQGDWFLMSNNIPKDQNVILQDLQQATRYELRVLANNVVGPTEMLYRFATLDSNGQTVYDEELPVVSEYEGGNNRGDYGEEGSMAIARPVARVIYEFVHSPLSFVLSTCLLVGVILMLLFYRLHRIVNIHSSSSSSSSTDSSNASGYSKSPQRSGLRHTSTLSGCSHDHNQQIPLGNHAACSMFESLSEAGIGGSQSNGTASQLLASTNDSPRLQLVSPPVVNHSNQFTLSSGAPQTHQQQLNPDCGTIYKSNYCNQNPNEQINEPCSTYMPITYACSAQNATENGLYPASGIYASLQAKETSIDDSHPMDQPCLVQMLMNRTQRYL